MTSQSKLELRVLSFFTTREKSELPAYLETLRDERWTSANREILALVREFAKSDGLHDSLSDWLVDLDPTAYVAIMGDFVPTPLGERALRELVELQETAYLDAVLAESKNLSVQERKDKLREATSALKTGLKPRSLLDTGKARVEERKLEAQAPSTGYRDLDVFIKGFIPGHIYTLSGDTNAGKSTICLNFAHRISAQGKRVLYFALEPENTVVDYLASIRLRKPFMALTDDDILFDDPNIDIYGKDQIRQVEDMVKAVRNLERYDLVIVDHIGYFTSGTNTTARQSDVMKDLAGLAKEKQSAVMLIQHLNKSKTDKASPENNITGSAAFKQDATDVLILSRDTKEDIFGATESLNTGAILIRKAKSDKPQGSVPIKFIEGTALILDGTDQTGDF